jgi:DMSO/TMAO reductase YedYZ molybdopterin-dependent catalytic subunit
MKNKHPIIISIAAIITLLILPPIGSATADNQTTLSLTDLTGTTYAFTYTQLFAMPKTEINADLYCDGALVTNGIWSGVALNYLLNQAQLTPEVSSIQLTASDGYQVAIPLDLAVQPQIIIAYELNGQPLPEGLRLVIPDANGAAWISKITFITMSAAGAPYPQAISVGHIKDTLVPTTVPTPKPSPPAQQENPIQPRPTATQNSSAILHEATPTNVTWSNSLGASPEVTNQGLNMQAAVYLSVAACAISFTLIAFVVFWRKRRQTRAWPFR